MWSEDESASSCPNVVYLFCAAMAARILDALQHDPVVQQPVSRQNAVQHTSEGSQLRGRAGPGAVAHVLDCTARASK